MREGETHSPARTDRRCRSSPCRSTCHRTYPDRLHTDTEGSLHEARFWHQKSPPRPREHKAVGSTTFERAGAQRQSAFACR